MTDRKTRQKMVRSEKLLAAALQKRDEGLIKWLRAAVAAARLHATAVAAIVLAGRPGIDEALNRAWMRTLRHYEVRHRDQYEAAQELYTIIVGHNDASSRFTSIFRTAPAWLLQFTGVALDARLLNFALPNISKKLRWGSSGFDDSRRWPLLPLETMSAGDPIPEFDLRRLIIGFCCIMTQPPFPSVEELLLPNEKKRTSHGRGELELLEYAVQAEIRADSDWSDHDKRRVRKLCDRLVRPGTA